MTNFKERVEEEFDEKFGKLGPEQNSDSIGIKAGCDDCAYNIKLREEHKSFIKQKMLELLEEVEGKVIEIPAVCHMCEKTGVNVYGECRCSYEDSKYITKKQVKTIINTYKEELK